jgi:hypothetical protein
MKKQLFIFLLLAIFTSCAALKKNYGIPDYQLGMSEQDFTASHKNNLVMVEATPGQTVYRRVVGFSLEGVATFMYYYFDNGKLVRMRRIDDPGTTVVVHQGR